MNLAKRSGDFSGVLMVKKEFNQGDTFLIQHMYVYAVGYSDGHLPPCSRDLQTAKSRHTIITQSNTFWHILKYIGKHITRTYRM